MTSYSQQYARIEIIITISVAKKCTNTRAKVFVLLRANCLTNCYYNFNPCGIFENMTSFTPILNEELEQGKLIAALNSRNLRSKQNTRCNVRNRLQFGKMSRKDLLCTKM